MAPRKATTIGRRSLALVALPRFSCKTTCYGVCLVLVELGVTIVLFSLYGVSQIHQSLYLVCSVISAVSIWGGIFGLCRSTPSAIASLIVAIAVTFAFVLLGGLCIVLSLDVHSAVATALNKSLMPVPQNANKKLVRDTKIYLALAASALLVSAGCHALLARHLTRLVGPRRGTIAFLQTFSLLVIPFSLFLVLGGQYIADSGTLASAPYTSLIIFGSGVLLLAIAVLAFIGGTFEYRRLLSLCMMFSYVTAALLVGLSIAYVAMRSRVDDYIVTHWELVRVVLPPTYQARYDQRQFVALVQSTLQTVAYVAIVCGLFVFQTAGVCASLMTHATAVKRQTAHDKQSIRGLEAQGNGADGEVASSSADPQVLQRHAWRQYFEASERRQRIAMRFCAFLFAVAVALILAVMSANVVFATKCHSIGKLVQEQNDTLWVSPNTTNGTAVSTLAITNRFASGMLTIRAATTKGNGLMRLEQYGNAERSKHESYVQSINGSTLTVDAQPFDVTRFLWLDGSCQRSVMDVGIPTDAARALHVHSNTSVDVRGGANGPSLTVSQLTVETDQANINASQLLVLDGGLALVSGSGEIDLSDTTVDGSRSIGIDTRAVAFAELGSLRADNVTIQDCDATLKTGAGTIEASRVFATATAGRSHLRLASTSGTIYAEQVRANWLELTTTNGAIAATALRTTGTSAFMGRLEVASVAGDIALQQVEPRGSVRVETSSGNVKLQLQTLAFTGLYFLHSDFGNVTIRNGLYGTDVIRPMRATASGGGLDKQGGVNCEPTNTSCLSYGELVVRSRLGDIEVVLGCDSFQCT